jgi:hypothetical protein
MPPRERSRHSFCFGWRDRYGAQPMFLDTRIPFRFQQRDDNRAVVAKTGDTLFSLAGRYFKPLPRACGLWWIIGDYQPQPIHDPTLQLAAGRVIVIPSLRTVEEEIFNDERAWETEA